MHCCALCALLLERWIERALHSTMFELASVARGVPPGSYALQRSDNRASSPPSAFLSAARIPRALCLRTPASVSPRTAAAVASYARMHRGAIRTIKLHEAGGVGAEALRGGPRKALPRLLVYTANPAAGLGNRINGLLSSFVLALATGRILLLDMPVARFGEQDGEKLGMPVGISSLLRSPFDKEGGSAAAARAQTPRCWLPSRPTSLGATCWGTTSCTTSPGRSC